VAVTNTYALSGEKWNCMNGVENNTEMLKNVIKKDVAVVQ
jgi:hypothetical protein